MEKMRHAASGHEATLRKAQSRQQGGRCPICVASLTNKNATSDHCHRTGLPRGTLCRRCNSTLGTLEVLGEKAALAVLTAARAKPQALLAAMRTYKNVWSGIHRDIVAALNSVKPTPKQAATLALTYGLDWVLHGDPHVVEVLTKRNTYRNGAASAPITEAFAGMLDGVRALQ
ncbi:MAG TPA: endonuclease domain-containing protein [Rhodocyclaceae bacterium]|nr:endonuclease domain-containing protein [Rhodocyclaceae bacterium]